MFFPGNYFEKNASSLSRSTDVLIGEKAVEMEADCLVSVYPAALDPQFQTFEYAVDKALISNELSYQIPVDQLAVSYTVVEDNEAALTISFAQPSAARFTILTTEGAQRDVFDPKVELQRTEDTILLTLPAIPEGKTAAVSVLSGAWEDAVVYCGENRISAEVADGAVTFSASGQKAQHRICRLDAQTNGILRLILTDTNGTVLHEIPKTDFTVTADAARGNLAAGSVLILAIYDKDGKQIGLKFQPIDIGVHTVQMDVEYTAQEASHIKAFILTDAEHGSLPACPAAEWKAT